MTKMNIGFWGTDAFAIPTLNEIKENIRVVICQPDQPAGRKRKLKAPATKEWAGNEGIPVLQPESLRDQEFWTHLSQEEWDLFLVISYGKIMPQKYLDLPRYGSINVHASLLPLLRGASPIESAIWQGFSRTGLSVQQMEARMDTGPILTQESIDIAPQWDSGDLRQVLAQMSARIIPPLLSHIAENTITAQAQDDALATYCGKIQKTDLLVAWDQSSEQISNQVRALSPAYGAYTHFRGKRVKIWRVEKETWPAGDSGVHWLDTAAPGQITAVTKEKLIVATGNGYLNLVTLQPENKKALNARDFNNGMRPQQGETLS